MSQGNQQDRYVKPGAIVRGLMNPFVAGLTKLGLSVAGSRVLRVRGRKSGEWRSVPVNLLSYQGERYLVSPRGHTQWTRNLRAAGSGELVLGRNAEPFEGAELPDEAKPASSLSLHIRRWKWEVGAFLEGLDENATDDQLLAAAPGFPVFRVVSKT
jgi:hypothetical protein